MKIFRLNDIHNSKVVCLANNKYEAYQMALINCRATPCTVDMEDIEEIEFVPENSHYLIGSSAVETIETKTSVLLMVLAMGSGHVLGISSDYAIPEATWHWDNASDIFPAHVPRLHFTEQKHMVRLYNGRVHGRFDVAFINGEVYLSWDNDDDKFKWDMER